MEREEVQGGGAGGERHLSNKQYLVTPSFNPISYHHELGAITWYLFKSHV